MFRGSRFLQFPNYCFVSLASIEVVVPDLCPVCKPFSPIDSQYHLYGIWKALERIRCVMILYCKPLAGLRIHDETLKTSVVVDKPRNARDFSMYTDKKQ